MFNFKNRYQTKLSVMTKDQVNKEVNRLAKMPLLKVFFTYNYFFKINAAIKEQLKRTIQQLKKNSDGKN